MAGFRSVAPNISINTTSSQLRTELSNTFARLDGSFALVPIQLSYFIGPTGNAVATESSLDTVTVNQGTLSKTGSSILIFACGKTAANANNKTLRLKFGTTELFTTGAQAFNNVDWTMNAEIVRTSSTTQTVWIQFFATSTLTQKVTVTTATVTLTTNQIIYITGEGVAANDISLYYHKMILLT